MKMQDRSYSTKIIRPKPLVHQQDDGGLIVVATSWGKTEHAQRALDEVVKYVNSAQADVEVTSPFDFLTALTDEVNYLRTALLITNDMLYRGENKSEYFSGVEILALFKRGSQVAWAHVGNPSVLIQRHGQRLQPLSMGLDLSAELSEGDSILPPLPAQLLGMDPTCYIQCGHTRVSEGDKLVLLGSASIATALWTETHGADMGTLTQRMIQESPETPFWLGLVQLD